MRNRAVPILAVALSMMSWSWTQAQAQASEQHAPAVSAAANLSSNTDSVANTKINSQNHSFSQRDPRYRLEPGDAFDVAFELSPEFNQHVTVQPDGYISLRGIDDIHVANETVPQLTATLKTAYSKILSDPLISVVLTDFQKPYFIANGQVRSPGKYELRGDITVTEGIAIAGGFLDSAKHSQVLLFRRVDDEMSQAMVINVKQMLKNKNLHEDLHLQPGDMLVVPKSRISKIEPYLPTKQIGVYAAPF
jgi:polysaccharide export outer membrane protein